MTAEDMTGQQFGKLTVLARDGTKGGLAVWLCRCECGNERSVTGHNLRKGMSTSCGCTRGPDAKHVAPGTRVGRLVVVGERGRMHNSIAYLCKCDCGGEKLVRGDRLRGHMVYSCGCARKRRAA
jgi:hypothetical protein